MNNLNKKEIKRQLFHLSAGILLTILLYLNIFNALIITIILIIGLIVSYLTTKIKIPVISWFLNNLDRNHDMITFPGMGAITFLTGCLFAVLLFEKNIALASILIMAVGDSISPLVGIHFGKNKNPLNKTKLIEGTVAGIIASFFAALIFVSYVEALPASIIAMVLESLDLRHKNFFLNDNITMPLVSGLVIYLLRLL